MNEVKEKCVLITERNFYNLIKHFFGSSDKFDEEIKKELTEKLDKNKYIIGLDHKPDDYGNEVNAKFDLVLSGHTHGGQMWPLGPISVYMGINDSYYGKKVIDDTTFIVSSGIGDWQVKFKTATISEYVVIDIKNK